MKPLAWLTWLAVRASLRPGRDASARAAAIAVLDGFPRRPCERPSVKADVPAIAALTGTVGFAPCRHLVPIPKAVEDGRTRYLKLSGPGVTPPAKPVFLVGPVSLSSSPVLLQVPQATTGGPVDVFGQVLRRRASAVGVALRPTSARLP